MPLKVGTKLVPYKGKDAANVAMEGSGSQTVEMMNRKERVPKMRKIENEKPISKLKFEFAVGKRCR